MFITSFKTTTLAIIGIFILGLLGFFLVKRKALTREGLHCISRLVIDVTLPLFIFTRFVREFRLSLFPDWWIFPAFSIILTALAFFVGWFFIWTTNDFRQRRQFFASVGFQNSGYLPLVLVAALLPEAEANQMFIYIFLFLVGFNLVIWSLGVHMLTYQPRRKFEFASLFSPPVIATLVGFLVVYLGLEKFMPDFLFRPLKMAGDSTLPLAILVVGGNLADLEFSEKINRRALFFALFAKLIILPVIILLILLGFKYRISYLVAFLLLMQSAMPPATSLSLIIRNYNEEDYLINPAIFVGHIISIFTIPVFLSLLFYFFR